MTRIATFNVNGVNGRLPVLFKWLGETDCDVVCLQELKTSNAKFPIEAIRDVGFGAIWHGQKSYNSVAILARGRDPVERRRGLPGDPDDTHSRYLEAEIDGLIVDCIYLPNGNPAPGPSSITSSVGSSVSSPTASRCWASARCFVVITTSCPPK